MNALGIDDLAKAGQPPGVTLVVGQPLKEIKTVALSKVRADADGVLADQVVDVLNRLDVVLDGLIDAIFHKGREHGDADETAVIGNEFQFVVGFVAWVIF